MLGDPGLVGQAWRIDHSILLGPPLLLWPVLLPVDAVAAATAYTGFACLPCTAAGESSSGDVVGGVVDAVHRHGRSLARVVWVMSVGTAASAVKARLLRGFRPWDSVHFHNSGCARGRARGGIVGTARSRSWWVCLVYKDAGVTETRLWRRLVVLSITPEAPLLSTGADCFTFDRKRQMGFYSAELGDWGVWAEDSRAIRGADATKSGSLEMEGMDSRRPMGCTVQRE